MKSAYNNPGSARIDNTRIAGHGLPLERNRQPTSGTAVTSASTVSQRPMLNEDTDPSMSPHTKKKNTTALTMTAAANANRTIHNESVVVAIKQDALLARASTAPGPESRATLSRA